MLNIDKMPTEFYTTDDYSVVMILQQDVDTIHSAGTVYVPVGNLRDRQNDVTKTKLTICVCIVKQCKVHGTKKGLNRLFYVV